MTAYTMTVGYNSGHSLPEVARELLRVVDHIRNHPELIIEEVMRVEPSHCRDIFLSYGEMYRSPGVPGDLTLTILSDKENKELPVIRQLASSGTGGRSEKEMMRRAFCRLVMAEMHKKEMEININVY